MKICCVYKIINIKNNKIYIGSTKNYNKRLTSHKSLLVRNKHSNLHLQSAWNAYNGNSFQFEIIQECSIENLIKLETENIIKYKSCDSNFGYNQEEPSKSRAGFEHTSITKDKISHKMSGNIHSESTKLQISLKMKKVAKNRSIDSYKKMAATKKNKPIPSLYKKVKCLELNLVFNSIKEAAEKLNLHRTGISMVLNGTMQTTGGLTFERV